VCARPAEHGEVLRTGTPTQSTDGDGSYGDPPPPALLGVQVARLVPMTRADLPSADVYVGRKVQVGRREDCDIIVDDEKARTSAKEALGGKMLKRKYTLMAAEPQEPPALQAE